MEEMARPLRSNSQDGYWRPEKLRSML